METTPFNYKAEEYTRDLNPIEHAIDEAAAYLVKMNNVPLEEAKKWLRENIKGRRQDFSLNNPLVSYTAKHDNGDRYEVRGSFYKYLMKNINDGNIISPTFTTYRHPSVKRSYLTGFIGNNKKERSISKKAAAAYKAAGDMLNHEIKHIEQNNRKILNNSISGASQTVSTGLYNPNMHPSLTSTARITTAFANSNAEKLIGGKRHYFNSSITLNNIINIINNIDLDNLEKTIAKYNLHYPTLEETSEIIFKNTKRCWRNREHEKIIQDLLNRLTPVERAAVSYVMDLYHIRLLNPEFIRNLMDRIITKPRLENSISNSEEIINKAPGELYLLAIQICRAETIGLNINSSEFKQSEAGQIVALTIKRLYTVLEDYYDFFSTFFRNKCIPQSIGNHKEEIRTSVLTGDTDSCLFTTEEWVEWYCGEILFDDNANSIYATVTFILESVTKHILAVMSANLGIETERLFDIYMKNECKFDVFVPTVNAKHYFAGLVSKEGIIYKDIEMLIKGVHLKSSNAPEKVDQLAQDMMFEVCNKIIKGEKISIREYLLKVAEVEKDLIKSIYKGEVDYFRTLEIKTADAYTQDDEESNYRYHLFWNRTFGQVYGLMNDPPYHAIKIPTVLDSKRKIKEYLSNIENETLRKALEDCWSDRKDFNTFYAPFDIVKEIGLPKEIISLINIRGMIADSCHVLYEILNALGVYLLDRNTSLLVSDLLPD